MHVITRRRLVEFWERFADAEPPLRAWYQEADKAHWACWADIKAQFGTADCPGNNRVVFNIGGNKYRLIVKVDFRAEKVFIRWIGTHAQYDRLSDVTHI